MKRLLSLLVVIAMVVSMIPSVFAANDEIDMDELLGRLVVLEDISLIEVKLDEGSDGKIYQWTPAADEEATELNLSWYPETAVLNVTATTGENTVSATTENSFGELTLPIVPGQLVEIEVSEANGAAVEGYIYGGLSGYPVGHETNPIMLGMVMEATIEKASWFAIKNFVGDLIITGVGAFNVNYEGETIAAVDGVVTLSVNAPMYAGAAMFQIDAAGAYTFALTYPVGSQENPAALVIGENVADIKAGSQGYMYTWTATEEGTLKITMPAGQWTYTLNNLTTSIYGDTQWSDMDPVPNPAEIAVAAGDEIQLIVNTYDPNAPWAAPEGQLTIQAELVLPEPPAPQITITAQPQSMYLKAGSAASVSVVAEGEGLTYQWKYRNAGETSWRNTSLTGQGTPTLTISGNVNVGTHNGRQYICFITDAAGNTVESEVATLKVAAITTDAKNLLVKCGESGTISVVYSQSENVTFRWEYKGNGANSAWANTTATGNKTNTITVAARATGTNHGYMYRCKITDANMLDENGKPVVIYSKEVYLRIVDDPAQVLNNPEDGTGVVGAFVPFSVEASGNGVQYQWQWLAADGNWVNTYGKDYNTATLQARATRYNNGRQFRCQIKTRNNTGWNYTYSEPATLTVLPAVNVVEPLPETITVKAGDQFELYFGAVAGEEGAAPLTYQWQWAKYAGNWKNVATAGSGFDTDTLTLVARADMNGRLYRVIVKNAYNGSYEAKSVKLIVE